jgi:DNA polymerase-3 subunit epsilon
MKLARYLPLEFRRKRLLQRTPAGPLHVYLSQAFVDTQQDYRKVTYLAIDMETTGLDSRRDHILSIGTVEVTGDAIDLATARHRIVSSDQPLPEQSVAIHHLTDDLIAGGEPIAVVLAEVLQNLAGKVLLAHHAAIETGFLDSACQRLFGAGFLAPVVDTLALAQQQLYRRNAVVNSGALRLAALRERYHLPRYKAHNALSDALAAAELFLAQAAERRGNVEATLPLKRLLVKM